MCEPHPLAGAAATGTRHVAGAEAPDAGSPGPALLLDVHAVARLLGCEWRHVYRQYNCVGRKRDSNDEPGHAASSSKYGRYGSGRSARNWDSTCN